MSAEVDLDADTCRALLVRGVVGRLAVWAYDGPRVHPFNHTVVDDLLVVRTRPGSAVARPAHEQPGAPAAFEVDEIDQPDQRGWSVQVRGPLAQLTRRRLGAGWDPIDAQAFRRLS